MLPRNLVVTGFSERIAPVTVPQERALEWLARAHARAALAAGEAGDKDRDQLLVSMRARVRRFSCGPDRIRRRASVVHDFGHLDFERMALYDHPRGRGTRARARAFATFVNAHFAAEYEGEEQPPADLLHVTCTGYAGPSGAQRLVAARGWGGATRVTHVYHMGCYAALPALRIAAGQAALGSPRVNLVHTELCTLHLDPGDHSAEQLVVQSLFADGLVRYSLRPAARASGLELLALDEILVPRSAEAMQWTFGDRGMQMSLSRKVPALIGDALRPFVSRLYAAAGLDAGKSLAATIFAVHPGGPRIIDDVQTTLELSEPQVAESRRVLLEHGNMSSATLPTIWMRLAADPAIRAGTVIVSLAFGPGLTIAGGLFRKRA